MALRYGFFDSEITGYNEEGMPEFDRAESSDFLAMFIAEIIKSGVLAVPGDCFQALAGEGTTVRVRPGFAVIKGRFAYDDEEAVLELAAADSLNKRIDRVILRVNHPARKCELLIRAGAPALNPQPPELLRSSGDYYELCLAEISIRANQSAITQADIADTRADSDVCGWVTQAIHQVDTHTLFLQWQDAYGRFYADSEAEFNAWMEGIREQFGEDIAGGALAKIQSLERDKADKASVFQKTLQATGWQGEDAPFTCALSVDGVTESSIVDISLSSAATQEQAKAWMAGQFADGGQEAGEVTVKAFGSKPEADIPVTVIVRGDA